MRHVPAGAFDHLGFIVAFGRGVLKNPRLLVSMPHVEQELEQAGFPIAGKDFSDRRGANPRTCGASSPTRKGPSITGSRGSRPDRPAAPSRWCITSFGRSDGSSSMSPNRTRARGRTATTRSGRLPTPLTGSVRRRFGCLRPGRRSGSSPREGSARATTAPPPARVPGRLGGPRPGGRPADAVAEAGAGREGRGRGHGERESRDRGLPGRTDPGRFPPVPVGAGRGPAAAGGGEAEVVRPPGSIVPG
jgi:hypothetical protein